MICPGEKIKYIKEGGGTPNLSPHAPQFPCLGNRMMVRVRRTRVLPTGSQGTGAHPLCCHDFSPSPPWTIKRERKFENNKEEEKQKNPAHTPIFFPFSLFYLHLISSQFVPINRERSSRNSEHLCSTFRRCRRSKPILIILGEVQSSCF